MRSQPIEIIVAALAFLIIAALPAAAGDTVARSRGQTLYVPIYSHIYSGDREHPFYLAATLSIRNTDPKHPVTLTAVDYYDTAGKLLRRYLEAPLGLQPLASVRYVIGERDKAGGSGANFLVTWIADPPATAPIIESVMIGTQTQQGISFTSRAQVIEEQGQ
jgi:hypothetical protein